MNQPNELRIRYLNVQHYTAEKEPALARHLTENNPDIILITSTSRPKINPIKILSYNTFTVNKTDERHAGCAIAIKKGIQFEIKNDFCHDTIGATIQTSKGPVVVMTSYAPPRNHQIPQQDLEYLIRNNYPTILAGDLNAQHSLFGYRSSSNAKGKQLAQHVYKNRINHIGPPFPTFHTRRSATTPDCILTNNKFFLNYHITPGGIGPSDHVTVDILITTNVINAPCRPIPDIKNTNWDTYKESLEAAPEINLDNKTALDLANEIKTLYNQLEQAKTAATPIKTQNIKNNFNRTAKFRRLSKILDRYNTQLQTTGLTPHLDIVIKETQNRLIQEGNICKLNWWENQITKIEQAANNNITFWKQIKINKGGSKQHNLPHLVIQENGRTKTAKTDKEKTEFFTKFWSNISQITEEENNNFCRDTEQRVNTHLSQNTHKTTPKWKIDLSTIKNEQGQLPFDDLDTKLNIKSLANKAPGPSKLKKPHYTNIPQNITNNITHIFNCCYALGLYPKQFKHAEVILIPKAEGSLKDPANYRPISLLNFLGKVFAKILNNKLITHLDNHGIIKESQHGFRKRRSSVTLIANLYERIAREKAGNRKTLVTLVLRDVKKAFDKVWHNGLIYKLMQSRIDTPMIRILSNFLHDRKAQIRVNEEMGEIFQLKAGVPQGDVLSPTLYLIMCNDFPNPTRNNQSKNFCHQYADDFTQVIISKFNTKINNAHKETHIQHVQDEILKQNTFDKTWKITTNMNKFQIIHIGVKIMPPVHIQNTIIPHTTTAKLLGLKFSNYNFFTKQVTSNVNRAKAELKNLYKFKHINWKLKLRLYKALVLPLLTYPIVPLNACSKAQVKKLQTVQNKAIKWICNEYWPTICPLQQRHEDLKLEFLNDRIKRLAEGVWYRILEENANFIQETMELLTQNPHTWFPSSYMATFN